MMNAITPIRPERPAPADYATRFVPLLAADRWRASTPRGCGTVEGNFILAGVVVEHLVAMDNGDHLRFAPSAVRPPVLPKIVMPPAPPQTIVVTTAGDEMRQEARRIGPVRRMLARVMDRWGRR